MKAELLDQTGKVMAAIPVTSALVAPDDAGIGWATADLSLVPLGAGDYIVRVEVVHPDGTVADAHGFPGRAVGRVTPRGARGGRRSAAESGTPRSARGRCDLPQ